MDHHWKKTPAEWACSHVSSITTSISFTGGGGVLPYRVPPGGSPRNIPSQMWGHRGPLSRELNPGAAGPGIGVSPINLKQNLKPRHFSFVGHCRGQGEDTTLGQTLIYFSKFFTKFRRNSGKPLLSCPQVNSVNCSSVMFENHSMSFYRILITFLTFTVCVNLDGIPFIYFCLWQDISRRGLPVRF